MTRKVTANIAMLLIVGLDITDYIVSLPNPYQAPAIAALGSGAVSAGGFVVPCLIDLF